MTSSIALFLWLVLLTALLRFDPAKKPGTPLALWVPVIWMFFVASRLPSQWLGFQVVGVESRALQEGNPVDRAIFSLLILMAIGVLVSRSFQWGDFFVRNFALMAFLSFALLSVVWSGFPLIAFKRWFRDLGNYVVILVVLSDPRPIEAVHTVLRRLCYLLVPLSIVLIKYYPNLGRAYSDWTGQVTYQGVTTGKNLLGVVCLISGIFFFWDTVTRWSERRERRTRRIILVNVAFIAMTLRLLNLASSATSSVCLALGCLVIAAAHTKWGRRHPGFLKAMAPASFLSYLILVTVFGINAQLAEAVGRNSTLTDRTHIWKALLSLHTNPLLGTGYGSFWLGPRLQWIWQRVGRINEAHNGYLQIYLDLGFIGLFLLGGFLISSYRKIGRRLKPFSSFGSLSLALWTIMLFYNVTEAAFKWHPMWIVFLMVAMEAPERINKGALAVPVFEAEEPELAASFSCEMAVQSR